MSRLSRISSLRRSKVGKALAYPPIINYLLISLLALVLDFVVSRTSDLLHCVVVNLCPHILEFRSDYVLNYTLTQNPLFTQANDGVVVAHVGDVGVAIVEEHGVRAVRTVWRRRPKVARYVRFICYSCGKCAVKCAYRTVFGFIAAAGGVVWVS